MNIAHIHELILILEEKNLSSMIIKFKKKKRKL